MTPRPPGWARGTMPSVGRDEESTAAGIYGVIVGAAVMAASHAERILAVAVAVLVTLVVYWTAERYARLVAARIHDGRRPGWGHVRQELTHGWEIVSASAMPLIVLLVAGGPLGASLYGAVLAALVASTVLLCLAGWEIGRDGRLTTRERLASACVAGLFGVAMVLLKALLH
jgi:hypothetical protein